ncbi:MAG: DNA polymerase III subunit alpha [Candidatus Saccharibacteria bacterium]|nr:DNA polymerase III subunit alpha [Candidatus Saccharibacteria bacterium]
MAKELTPANFVHLHNHTQYSLLDGLTKIPALIEYVNEMGMKAVAITDHGTLSGAVEFYKTAKAGDVKPIIGMETYVAPRGHTDRDPSKDKTPFHLIVLAMNNQGYQNLMRLSTTANLDGFYYKPRVDHDLLEKYNEGLIILSGCIGGEIGDALRQGQYDKAVAVATWYKSIFGDRYYFEVQDHGHLKHPARWVEQTAVNDQIFKLSAELDIPVVVTSDAHYLRHEDQEAHEILLCVQTGSFLSDEKRMSLKEFELHVTEPEEIIKRWGADHPDVIANTRDIADRCDVELKLGEYLIPKFSVPDGESEKSYLDKLTFSGLLKRYNNVDAKASEKMTIQSMKDVLPPEVVVRADYELGTIDRMGFNGYFLIVQDFINWGKNEGIIFGPGRGSGAGSIVAFALRITELDPLKYELLFERFLNPDRISMPDFDIDIQDSRREEVIQYCVRKYGKERVANIVTFGKMAARNAVRDVSRVLQVPYAEADRLAKMIPPPVQGRHIPLSKSIVDDPDLKREYEASDLTKRVFDLAIRLEGTIRSHGVHAAGVVIAPDDIVKFAPLEMAQKGVVSTQYSMGPVEELGLLKMDFLGLSNLTTIKNALRIIKKVYKKDIDINTLPLDDAATYKLLAKGDTTGVFQLESAGMKRYLKDLKPTVFDDIVAMGALYRPGPMQWIEDFIARKHGLREIEYLHPAMEPALKPTYGIIVYQEQVMQISREMCGFTGGQSDTLRKAIGKKKPEEMAKMKAAFIDGAIKTVGANPQVMEKFWGQLEAFAAYAFPKAHAACYALTSYHTAYLKAHYPAAFMAALMTSDFDDTDRLSIEISECKHMGLEVLAPDVNQSFGEFAVVPGETVKQGQIRFGMNAVKNVGSGAVEDIILARDIDGKFSSLEDFLAKVNSKVVNRKTMESLIKSGAFSSFETRGVLLNNLDTILAYSSRLHKEKNSGQTDLFGNQLDSEVSTPKLALDNMDITYTSRDELQWERDLLGLYLSQHPLEQFTVFLDEQTVPLASIKPEHDGKLVTIGGIIMEFREISTKNGQKMAFVKIADQDTECELVLFPSIYQKTIGIWQRDHIVLVKGKVNGKDREGNIHSDLKILVDDAREVTIEQAIAYETTGKKQRVLKTPSPAKVKNTATSNDSKIQRLYIRIKNSEDSATLSKLKNLIDENAGETEVVLVLGEESNKQIIKLPLKISIKEKVTESLNSLVGAENVKIN